MASAPPPSGFSRANADVETRKSVSAAPPIDTSIDKNSIDKNSIEENTASSQPARSPANGHSTKRAWPCDRELVDEILAGSREHFDMLYEAYFPRVFRFALKRLNDRGEAEDVTQEVFLTLLSALPSYQGQSSLLVWIFGITRNKVNRRFRKPRPRLEVIEEGGALDVEGREAPTDEIVDARRMLAQFESLIAEELTPLQRRIFHLKHMRHQPIRVIAEALGKSEDAIKANLYRMRRCIADGIPGLDIMLRS